MDFLEGDELEKAESRSRRLIEVLTERADNCWQALTQLNQPIAPGLAGKIHGDFQRLRSFQMQAAAVPGGPSIAYEAALRNLEKRLRLNAIHLTKRLNIDTVEWLGIHFTALEIADAGEIGTQAPVTNIGKFAALIKLPKPELETSAAVDATKGKLTLLGRKQLSPTETQKRTELIQAWNRAKETGESQREFCRSNSVTVKHLRNCLAWNRMREMGGETNPVNSE